MISVGNNKAVICKGDFRPAQLYKGDKKIAGYNVEEFEGENGVTLENCYNDKLHNTQIIGNTVQDGTPTPEAPVEVQSVGELVTEGEYTGRYKIPVMARGKNFIDKNNIKIISVSCRSYEKNDDLIIVQGNEGLAANAASAGNIRFAIPETLPSGTYTFSMYATLLEEGIWGTSASIYAGASLDTYSEKNFSYENNIVGAKTRIKFTATFSNGLGCVVMRLNSSKWSIDISSLQIEEGSTATPCEPYIEPQTFNIYLDEPLRKTNYGGRICADYIDFEKSIVARYNFAEAYDGTETWSMFTSSSTGLNNFAKRITTARTVKCSHYQMSGSIASIDMSASANYSARFYITDSRFSTVDEFKAFLAEQASLGTPVTAVFLSYDAYANKNPIEEPITLPKLPTFKGTTIYEIDTQIPATISGKYKRTE